MKNMRQIKYRIYLNTYKNWLDQNATLLEKNNYSIANNDNILDYIKYGLDSDNLSIIYYGDDENISLNKFKFIKLEHSAHLQDKLDPKYYFYYMGLKINL